MNCLPRAEFSVQNLICFFQVHDIGVFTLFRIVPFSSSLVRLWTMWLFINWSALIGWNIFSSLNAVISINPIQFITGRAWFTTQLILKSYRGQPPTTYVIFDVTIREMSGGLLHHCTEVCFASFLSGGFITVIVVNPPERKLAKHTSMQWQQLGAVASTVSISSEVLASVQN